MTRTLAVAADLRRTDRRCADCRWAAPRTIPELARRNARCENCWWADQTRRHLAGRAVQPLAHSVLHLRPDVSSAGE